MSSPINPNISHDFNPIFSKYTLHDIKVGDLFLPTGKIVCGDPFFLDHLRPFNQKVATGKYPVIISIYKVEEDHHRVAFGRIQLSDAKPVRWELAFTEDITDEQIASIQPGEFYGYGVDAGLSCFTDEETNKMFSATMTELYKKDETFNYYDNLLAEEFKASAGSNPLSRPEGDWNNHFPIKGDDRNVVMFSSGWGDGSYPVYWGFDEAGTRVELRTDFGVVGYEEE